MTDTVDDWDRPTAPPFSPRAGASHGDELSHWEQEMRAKLSKLLTAYDELAAIYATADRTVEPLLWALRMRMDALTAHLDRLP